MNSDINQDQWYWEVTATCHPEAFELVSYYAFENNASGIEEMDPSIESIQFKIYFPSSVHNPGDVIKSIEKHIKKVSIEIDSIEKKNIENWQTNWQEHFKPIRVGEEFLVRPPWESSKPNKKEIVINPGLGFGTGYHESTAIALQLLEWLASQSDFEEAIDVGTGSGILAIGASLTGVKQVTAMDIDKDALSEVKNNFILSGLDEKSCNLLLSGPGDVSLTSELVMANIEGHILLTLAKDLLRLTAKNGYLILSGILAEQKKTILEAFIKELAVVKELKINEWYGVILKKNTAPNRQLIYH